MQFKMPNFLTILSTEVSKMMQICVPATLSKNDTSIRILIELFKKFQKSYFQKNFWWLLRFVIKNVRNY